MTVSLLGIAYVVVALAAAIWHGRLWRARRGFTRAGVIAWLTFGVFAGSAVAAFKAPDAPYWQVLLLGLFCGLLTYAYLWGTQRHHYP